MEATEKQLGLITWITEELGVEFTGSSKKEATSFISEHIEEAKIMSESYSALMEGEWNQY